MTELKTQFESLLKECPVVAILRGITAPEVEPVCDILYEAGIRLLEIPLNSPDPFRSIKIAVKHCGSSMMVGAGTVLTPDQAASTAAAGGRFIIAPNTDCEVIRKTKELGLLSIPGFFTASEGFAAIKAGADCLKLFPACLGPQYVKDLKAVIKVPIMAVGGVNAGNLRSFLDVCCGAGIGSALYKSGKTLDKIREDALAMVKAAKPE